jgi:tRNA dimethylallyltransferase
VTIVGLRMDRAALYRRIDARVDAMVVAGLADEVRALLANGYSCDLPSMSGIGYRQICAHLRGECSLDEAVARIKLDTHRLARMQHAWFRADDPRIHWIDLSHAAGPETVVASALATITGRV